MNGCPMLLLSILSVIVIGSHGYMPCPREKFCSCLGNNIYCERATVKDIPWKKIPTWVELISLRQIYDLEKLSGSWFPVLPKLKKLNITSCRKLTSVGGDLPSKLPNLYLLRITQSGLTSSPAFDSPLHALRVLILNNNNLTKLDPKTSSSMPLLEHVEINHNRLTDLDSAWFKKGNQITFLAANGNRIARLSPDLGGVLNRLRVLRLNKNRLRALVAPPSARKWSREGAVPQSATAANPVVLPPMPSVEHLELARNRMVRIGSLTFHDWRSLKTLVLRKNNLRTPETGAFYIEEGGLRELDLMGNPSIDRLDSQWAYGFDSLQRLVAARCGIRVIDRTALATMGPALRHLDLSANKLQRLEGGLWSSLKRLRVLKLAGNSLTRLPNKAFQGLTELRELSLGVNSLVRLSNLEGTITRSVFAPLGNLTVLDLSFNRLTRISKSDLQGPAAGLQQLLLNGNNLTMLEASAFTQLSHLSLLKLDSTQLTCDCDAATISSWLHASPKLSQGVRGANCSRPSSFARTPLLALQALPFAASCAKKKRPAVPQHRPPASAATSGLRGLPRAALVSSSGGNDGNDGNGPLPTENTSVELLRGGVLRLRCLNPAPPLGEEHNIAEKLGVSPTGLGSEGVTFRWFRQLNQLKLPLVADPPRVTIRTGVLPGHRPQWYSELRVGPVDLQDAGTYRCFIERANPRLEPDLSPLFNVSVYVPPKFTDKPNAVISAMVGENIQIPCAASGHPPPHSSLRKRGGTFFPAAKDHRLSFFIGDPNFMLSEVKREDAGDYSCESVNAGGNISQPFRLVVNQIPRLKVRPATEQDFDAGQPAVLACKVEGWPFPKVVWMKDGKKLELSSSVGSDKRNDPPDDRLRLNSRDQLLVFSPVTPADAGVYVCELHNAVGRRKARIVVNVRTPNGVYPGDPSRLSRDKANWMLSNMTGIVVIAVVSCVVVTSIVWVAALFCLKRRLRRKACARAASLIVASESAASNLSVAHRGFPSSSRIPRGVSPLLSSSIYITSMSDSLPEVELAEQMAMLQDRRALPHQHQTRPNVLVATTTFHAPGDSAPASPMSSVAPASKGLSTKVACDDVEAPSSGYNSGNSDYSVGCGAGASGSEESSSGEQLSLRSLSSAGVYAQPPRLNIRRRSDSEEDDEEDEDEDAKTALCSVAVTDLSERLPNV